MEAIFKWIRRQSSLNAVNVSVGLFGGLLFGAGLALPIARPEVRDWFQAVMVSVLAGGVIGSIVGSVIVGVFKGRQAARKMMQVAYHKYGLDPDKLTALAKSYPGRIRRAVKFALGQDLF